MEKTIVLVSGSYDFEVGIGGELEPRFHKSIVLDNVPNEMKNRFRTNSFPYYPYAFSPHSFLSGRSTSSSSSVLDYNFFSQVHRKIYSEKRFQTTKRSYSEGLVSLVKDERLEFSQDDTTVLMTVSPLSPSSHIEHAAMGLIEGGYSSRDYLCPRLSFELDAVLSLYSTGRTTGLVVEIGHRISHIVPVVEGIANPVFGKIMYCGGKHIESVLTNSIANELQSVSYGYVDEQLIRSMKETCCFVSEDFDEEYKIYHGDKKPSNRITNEKFELSDGNFIQVGDMSFVAPEILFHPELFGFSEGKGLSELIIETIEKTTHDSDTKSKLFHNILLSGGTSNLPGLEDRISSDLRKKNIEHSFITLLKPNVNRQHCSFIGGSILSTLSSFQKYSVITNEEYDDYGACIFNSFIVPHVFKGGFHDKQRSINQILQYSGFGSLLKKAEYCKNRVDGLENNVVREVFSKDLKKKFLEVRVRKEMREVEEVLRRERILFLMDDIVTCLEESKALERGPKRSLVVYYFSSLV